MRQSSDQLYGYMQVLEQKPLSNLALISDCLETAVTVQKNIVFKITSRSLYF